MTETHLAITRETVVDIMRRVGEPEWLIDILADDYVRIINGWYAEQEQRLRWGDGTGRVGGLLGDIG